MQRSTRSRAQLSTLVISVGVILALTACGNPGSQNVGSDGASASALQQQEFPAVYDQVVAWQSCEDAFGFMPGFEDALTQTGGRVTGIECAWITVPMDWNDSSNTQEIQLAAVRVPATGSDPVGSLFSNPGGPGASGINFTIGSTLTAGFAPIQESYDLIGFDPRGMGLSAPLDCENDTSIFELALAKCADQSALAVSMGSTQVARDLDLMRHLVGDEELNYTGFSYGTVIGSSYATIFPERVGRIVLDSAWPSDWSSPLGSYQQREAIAKAMTYLVEQCGEKYVTDHCPIASEETMQQTIAQLDAAPLIASDGTRVTGATVSGYLTTALYLLEAGRSQILDVVGRALAHEQEAIDELAAAMADGGSRVSLSGMVVRCLSSPHDANLIGLYGHINEHGLPKALGGPEISDETLKPFFDLACDGLPNSGEDFLQFSNTSENPVLVIGIKGDHATPYEGAQQLVRELGNARLLTLDEPGHIASFMNRSTCADDAATAYLLEGTLPDEGTVCYDD